MRRRRAEVIEVTPSRQVQRQAPPDDNPEDFFPVDENIQRFLAKTGEGAEDAEVKVYRIGGPTSGGGGVAGRVTPPQMRDEFLYKCAPDEFDESLLQASYGAGTYRIKLYGTNAAGNYGIMVNKTLAIGALPSWKKNEVLAAAAAAAAPAVVTREPNDTAAIVTAITTALAPLLGKLGEGGAQSRKAMLEEMQLMSAMFRQPAAPSADPISQLGALLALVNQSRGNEITDPDAAPFQLIQKALDTFGPLLQQRQAAAAPAALPAPAAKAAATQPVQSEEEQVNLIQRAALAGQLALLVNAAKMDADPDMYATLIFENAPDEVLAQLEAPMWFENLCQLEEGFKEFKPWCEKVRAALVAIIAEEKEPDLPSTGKAGDNQGDGTQSAG